MPLCVDKVGQHADETAWSHWLPRPQRQERLHSRQPPEQGHHSRCCRQRNGTTTLKLSSRTACCRHGNSGNIPRWEPLPHLRYGRLVLSCQEKTWQPWGLFRDGGVGSLISSEVRQLGPLQRGRLTAGGGERCVNSSGESAYWNRCSWKGEVRQCWLLKRICERMCLEAELTATKETLLLQWSVEL